MNKFSSNGKNDDYKLSETKLGYEDESGEMRSCDFRGRYKDGHLLSGEVRFEDGRIYVGEFNKDNEPDGIGSMLYTDAVFSGRWKAGDKVFGTWLFRDGHTQIADYNCKEGYFFGCEFYPEGGWTDGLYLGEDKSLVYGDKISPGEDDAELVDVYGLDDVLTNNGDGD